MSSPSKLFLLALLVRTVHLVIVRPSFESPYWALAHGLLSRGSLAIEGITTTEFEPVYPLFLAASRVIGRHNPFVVQLFQVAVASAGAVYLYRLANFLTERKRVAVVAGALFALDPLLVRQAALPGDSALVTTLVVAFTYRFVSATTVRQTVFAGVLLALAVLTRAMLAPLVFAAAILLAQRQWRAALAGTATSLALVLPWLLWMQSVNGSWRPTRSGLNLYIGNSVYSDALLPDHDLDLLQTQANALVAVEVPHLPTLSHQDAQRAADEVLTRSALNYMAARPLRTLGAKARNALYFLSPRLVPFQVAGPETRVVIDKRGEVIVTGAKARPLLEVVAYSVSYTPVLIAAMCGVYLRRQRLKSDTMLWCVVTTFLVVYSMYVPATRYRAPMSFVMFFYAAVALDRWFDTLRYAGRSVDIVAVSTLPGIGR